MTTAVSTATTSQSTALARLISQVRAQVRSGADAGAIGRAVAELLEPCLQRDDFLTPEQMEPATDGYRQHILHVEPDESFSVVSLVWLPGQQTCIHDHVSWCVVGVYLGQEHETVYEQAGGKSDPHLVVTGNKINPRGSVAALIPPGDIHHVENGGDELAISIHIYGADIAKLGCSIRRRYDLEIRQAASL